MLNFDYYSPTKFVFGEHAEEQTGELTAPLTGSRRILIVYGSSRIEEDGLLARIEASLQADGISWVKLSGVKPNPEIGLVREGVSLVRREGVDFILAVGGGSVLDTGKAIACGARYDGDISSFLNGSAEPEDALPIGVVLTLSATGSEGSNCAVITNDEGEKAGICSECIRPRFAVMNPALTCSVPKWHTACGSSDILAHILEPYFTNTPDVDITDELIEGLIRTVVKYAPIAVKEPDNYNARADHVVRHACKQRLFPCGTHGRYNAACAGRAAGAGLYPWRYTVRGDSGLDEVYISVETRTLCPLCGKGVGS